MRGRPGFSSAGRAGGQRLYARAACRPRPRRANAAGGEAQRFVQDRTFRASGGRCFIRAAQRADRQALKANPDLQSAQAALRVARENVYAQQGAYYPSVQGNSRRAGTRPQPARSRRRRPPGDPYYSLYTAQLNGLLYAGRLRPQSSSRRIAPGASRLRAVSARSHLSDVDLERRRAAVQEASLRGQIAMPPSRSSRSRPKR